MYHVITYICMHLDVRGVARDKIGEAAGVAGGGGRRSLAGVAAGVAPSCCSIVVAWVVLHLKLMLVSTVSQTRERALSLLLRFLSVCLFGKRSCRVQAQLRAR